MANVISSLLVGIGFDYDKKSGDAVTSGIDGVKSKALQLGAVVGGAFGANALTFGFASAADELGKFGEVYGVIAEDVKALGDVFRHQGGSLESFMGQLSTIETLRAGLLTGDAGFIAEVAKAGIDPQSLIQAENALDGFLSLADQFQSLSREQRLNAAKAIGLDDAAVRVLSQGRTEIEGQVAAQKELFRLTEDMTAESARFNDVWQDFGTSLSGITSQISNILLPTLSDSIESMTELTQAVNKPLQDDGFRSSVSSSLSDPHYFDKMLFGREINSFSDLFGGNQPASMPSGEALTIGGQTLTPSSSGTIDRRPVQVNSTIHATIEMDGNAVAKKVIQVNEMQDAEAIQNLTSAENR